MSPRGSYEHKTVAKNLFGVMDIGQFGFYKFLLQAHFHGVL